MAMQKYGCRMIALAGVILLSSACAQISRQDYQRAEKLKFQQGF